MDSVLATKQPAALLPMCMALPTYLLGSWIPNQAFSALQPCINLWTGSSARLKRRGITEEKTVLSTWGPVCDTVTAVVVMSRGAVMVPQQQNLRRVGERAWTTRDPLEGQTAMLESSPSAWPGMRAAARSAYLGLDCPQRQLGQGHLQYACAVPGERWSLSA